MNWSVPGTGVDAVGLRLVVLVVGEAVGPDDRPGRGRGLSRYGSGGFDRVDAGLRRDPERAQDVGVLRNVIGVVVPHFRVRGDAGRPAILLLEDCWPVLVSDSWNCLSRSVVWALSRVRQTNINRTQIRLWLFSIEPRLIGSIGRLAAPASHRARRGDRQRAQDAASLRALPARRVSGGDRAAVDLLESRRDRPVPQVPPADLRRGRRAGGGGADALERARERQDPPGLPVRRPAGHRQDLAGADPRQVGQLQARADRRTPTAPATPASRSRTAPRST